MGTLLYLECRAHPEPVKSTSPVGHHLYDLATIRACYKNPGDQDVPSQNSVRLAAQETILQFASEHKRCAQTRIVSFSGDSFSL